ncbi:ABC transporter ATP-binding protein [Streptomyces californicus]
MLSFAEESERLVDLEVRSNMAGRWRMSTIGIVMAAMPAAIYWAAGLTFASGAAAVSIGTLVAFVTLQQGLRFAGVSLLCHRGADADLPRALPADLRIPRPHGGHHRTGDPVRLEKIRGEIAFEGVESPATTRRTGRR